MPSPSFKPSAVVATFLRDVRAVSDSHWDARLLPSASLLHGRAGLAFFHVEHFRVTGERASLDAARELANAAHRVASASPNHAFTFREGPRAFRVEDLAEGVFTGWAGIGYTLTLVGAAAADDALITSGTDVLVASFERHTRLTPRLSELFAGTAGYLAAVDDLRRRGIASRALEGVGNEAARLLLEDVAAPLSKGATLGAAHGRTGELLALVRARPQASERIRASLDELRSFARKSDDYVMWPVSCGARVPGSMWSSFCNGVVGQAILFDEASNAYRDDRYAAAASGAIECLRSIETPALGEICCGEAGQSIALNHHARLTASTRDLRASRARLATAAARTAILEPLSLFQGQPGVAFLAMLANARRPFFLPLFVETGDAR